MEYYLFFGLTLGLVAGLSPGPLLTLVISETLNRGTTAGIKVAMAPLITDIPIVLLMLYIALQLSDIDTAIGILSLVGSCYVFYLAADGFKSASEEAQSEESGSSSTMKGVLTNLLSPHPYVFWLTVGAPIISKASAVSAAAPAVFIAAFYLPLVGSKVLLAQLTGKYRHMLAGSAYKRTVMALSFFLVLFAALLMIDGIRLLGFLA